MRSLRRLFFIALPLCLLLRTSAQETAAAKASDTAPALQVVHPGPFNAPQQVMDAQGQWTTAIPISSANDLDLLIEDVSATPWLQANANRFLTTGQYTLTALSFYKSRRACREDQIATGFSDNAHVDACNVIRYRIRQMTVDASQSVVTVNFAAMVLDDGTLDPNSVRQDVRARSLRELDPRLQAAISKATALVAKQSEEYNLRQQPSRR